jgi:hypothetical protein
MRYQKHVYIVGATHSHGTLCSCRSLPELSTTPHQHGTHQPLQFAPRAQRSFCSGQYKLRQSREQSVFPDLMICLPVFEGVSWIVFFAPTIGIRVRPYNVAL